MRVTILTFGCERRKEKREKKWGFAPRGNAGARRIDSERVILEDRLLVKCNFVFFLETDSEYEGGMVAWWCEGLFGWYFKLCVDCGGHVGRGCFE